MVEKREIETEFGTLKVWSCGTNDEGNYYVGAEGDSLTINRATYRALIHFIMDAKGNPVTSEGHRASSYPHETYFSMDRVPWVPNKDASAAAKNRFRNTVATILGDFVRENPRFMLEAKVNQKMGATQSQENKVAELEKELATEKNRLASCRISESLALAELENTEED